MKKYDLLLLSAWFILCSITGFLLFYIAGRITTTPVHLPPQKEQAITSQYNLLIIQVDNLQRDQLNIKEAWMLFVTLSNPPGVILKELDTQAGTMQASDLLKSLQEGKPICRESTQLLSDLQVSWNGYLLFDDEGKKQLLIPLVPSTQTSQRINPSYRNSDGSEDSVCDVFLGMPSYFEKVKWSELIPKHLETNLELSDVLKIYDLIYHSTAAVECKEITK